MAGYSYFDYDQMTLLGIEVHSDELELLQQAANPNSIIRIFTTIKWSYLKDTESSERKEMHVYSATALRDDHGIDIRLSLSEGYRNPLVILAHDPEQEIPDRDSPNM